MPGFRGSAVPWFGVPGSPCRGSETGTSEPPEPRNLETSKPRNQNLGTPEPGTSEPPRGIIDSDAPVHAGVISSRPARLASSALPLGIDRVFARQGSDAIFRHGVASGDPLRDRVVLWTRVTPGEPGATVDVDWMIARDARMTRMIARGRQRTSAERDYTIKIDAVTLDPGNTYYFRFASRGAMSPIGRTRTLPARPTRRVRLALASCANLPFGFFNVYARIAARLDLDAVAPPRRLPLRVREQPLPEPHRGRRPRARTRAVSRSRADHARRLSRALRAISRGSRSPGGASPASVDCRLGRPRDRQQRVERRRRQPQRGRRRLGGAQGCRVPGVARVDAGSRDRRAASSGCIVSLRWAISATC